MFTWSTQKAFVVLVAAFAGLGALGVALTVVGQVECHTGCIVVSSGCLTPTIFRQYDGSVSSELYQDPNVEPDKVRDYVMPRIRFDWTDCQCPCKYVDCDHPCAGYRTGGDKGSAVSGYWTRRCVDKTLGGGNSVEDDPFSGE